MKKHIMLLASSLLFLTACHSGLSVTYHSSPQSARLMCGGQYEGDTPVTLNYTINKQNKLSGVVNTVPCQAVWVSGATALYRNVFPINSDSHWYKISATSTKVSAIDLQYDAQRMQAYQAYQNSVNDMINSMQQNRSKTTSCNRYGNQVLCNTF